MKYQDSLAAQVPNLEIKVETDPMHFQDKQEPIKKVIIKSMIRPVLPSDFLVEGGPRWTILKTYL